ncbi:hypothetical protein BH09MYX1_BH09MYX1_60890 [soil metagenome]
MSRIGLFSATVAVALCTCASTARADPSPWRRYEHVHFGSWGLSYAGSRLEGQGSVARIRHAAVDFDVGVTRFISGPVGFDLRLVFFPPLGTDVRELAYGRLDVGFDAGLARWGGAVPGAFIVGAGIGGDFGRYSYAGRIYPRLSARLRLRPSEHVALFVGTEIDPAAFGPDTRVFEARTELGFAWRPLMLGFRARHVVATGGFPARDYVQQELGLFVGVGLL